MGWLDWFTHAEHVRAKVRAARNQPVSLAIPHEPATCRRCGCDVTSCREWNCPTPDPDESYGPGWKRTSDPGMTGLRTDYEHRRYG